VDAFKMGEFKPVFIKGENVHRQPRSLSAWLRQAIRPQYRDEPRVRVGDGCERLHDRLMRDLNVGIIECDEQWDFIAKKQKRVQQGDPTEFGDVWLHVAFSATHKAVIPYVVGKGTARPLFVEPAVGPTDTRADGAIQAVKSGTQMAPEIRSQS